MDKFRKCYEPHLRDYPSCFEECSCDVCKVPLFSEESDPKELEAKHNAELMEQGAKLARMEVGEWLEKKQRAICDFYKTRYFEPDYISALKRGERPS